MGSDLSVHFHDCPTETPSVSLLKDLPSIGVHTFVIQNGDNGEQYVVGFEETRIRRSDFGHLIAESQPQIEHSTVIVINKRTGSDSVSGYLGTGVYFLVSGFEDENFFLCYHHQLKIWNHEQWLRRIRTRALPNVCYTERDVRHRFRFIIKRG
jgi:hypothetical protein